MTLPARPVISSMPRSVSVLSCSTFPAVSSAVFSASVFCGFVTGFVCGFDGFVVLVCGCVAGFVSVGFVAGVVDGFVSAGFVAGCVVGFVAGCVGFYTSGSATVAPLLDGPTCPKSRTTRPGTGPPERVKTL